MSRFTCLYTAIVVIELYNAVSMCLPPKRKRIGSIVQQKIFNSCRMNMKWTILGTLFEFAIFCAENSQKAITI